MPKFVVLIEIEGDPREFPELLDRASGLYRVPTLFCYGHQGVGRRGSGSGGFTWGKKFGWMVCSRCSKPYIKAWINDWNTPFDSIQPFGKNQLNIFRPGKNVASTEAPEV